MRLLDLAIIGGGPAGITAGIYAKRAMVEVALIEKGLIGGQVALAGEIENYPGFPRISGLELSSRLDEHARTVGLEVINGEVVNLNTKNAVKRVRIGSNELQAKAIIIASGAEPVKLNVDGEEGLLGKGVSYCATCDGPLFKDKVVAVVGGGDSAVKEAIHLAKIADKVYLIHRRDKLRAEKIAVHRMLSNPKITPLWNMVVRKIMGKSKVEKLLLKDTLTAEARELEVDGVFIYIGRRPNTSFVQDVEKDESGYVRVDEKMTTSAPGVFAAGDCTSPLWRQVATSVGEGAKAAMSAVKYLESLT
ncbi:MAG: thioredoxin-disulfide reductase [Candidatus Bathyarchaeia archaeon]